LIFYEAITILPSKLDQLSMKCQYQIGEELANLCLQ